MKLAHSYLDEAYGMLLSKNSDSINKAYDLQGQVLQLNEKFIHPYMSRFAIDYMRDSLTNAFKTATAFVAAHETKGQPWVYLGVIQSRLGDSIAAIKRFEKALAIYEKDIKEMKKEHQHLRDLYTIKVNILKNFLGQSQPLHASTTTGKNKAGATMTVSYSIPYDSRSVEEFVKRYINTYGIYYFTT